jgi:hypothetical protein
MAKKKLRSWSRRLDQIDETKLSLALWLIARELVDDRTAPSFIDDDLPVETTAADEEAA